MASTPKNRTTRAAWKTCAAVLWLFLAPLARAQESRIVPGLMGPNALPTLAVEDAALVPEVIGEIGGALHLTGYGAADRALTPRLRLLVPFLSRAALELEAIPLEVWRVSPGTRARTGAVALSGVTKGDVSFGARFVVLHEGARSPALTLRLLTKSTTGKSLDNVRFTNSPAYAIQALAAKDVAETGLLRVRVLTKLGFLSWSQDKPGLQDDAIDYGAAVDGILRAGTELRAELRGYQGYQSHDKPMVAALRLVQPVRAPVAVVLGVARGLSADAPAWELRAAIRFTAATPFGIP